MLVADLSDDLQYVFQSDNLRTDNPGVSAFDTIGAVNYLFYATGEKSKLGGRIEWWKADGVSFNEFTIGWNYNVLNEPGDPAGMAARLGPGHRPRRRHVCDRRGLVVLVRHELGRRAPDERTEARGSLALPD